MFRYGISLALLVFTFFSATANAECEARFKQSSFTLEIEAGETFEQTLRDLLVDPLPSTNLVFGFFPSAAPPDWAKIEGAQNLEKLIANAPVSDAGTYNTKMAVACETDAGDISDFILNVRVTPKWTDSTIQIEATEEISYELDLKSKVSTKGNIDALEFSASGLENYPWLSLSGSKLTGTPVRKDVGTINGITFTATDPSGGNASVPGQGSVKKVTKPPRFVTQIITLGDGEEGTAYSEDLSQFVIHTEPDPNNLYTLNYEILEKSNEWIQIGATNGEVNGTPTFDDSGTTSAKVKVYFTEDGTEYADEAIVQLVVKNKNRVPQWKEVPRLTATEDVLFEADLSTFVDDGDVVSEGDSLTFELIAAPTDPTWVSLSSNGKLFRGTPAQTDVGENTFSVRVTDSQGASAESPVIVEVQPVNDPPFWNPTTIKLPDALVGNDYQQQIAQFAFDPDNTNDELSFSKINSSQSPWVQVDSRGGVTGNPDKSDEGVHEFDVSVTDPAGRTAEAKVVIEVKFVNSPPVWTSAPKFNATEDTLFEGDLAPFVSDKDLSQGDALSFELVNSPSGNTWASISTDGKISGTPLEADVGTNTFKVKVNDSFGGSAEETVTVEVAPVNDAPQWTQDPVTLPVAIVGKGYNESLRPYVADPDNSIDELVFEKLPLSGTNWLEVDSQGNVTANPDRDKEGQHSFRVRVTDPGNLSDVAEILIEVKFVNTPPVWTQSPVFEATEDVLFVEDLTPFVTDPDLNQGDQLTFELINPQPSDTWINVSSDGTRFEGTPLEAHTGVNKFTVRVRDQFGGSADETITVNVAPVNDAPQWTQNPINLPDGFVNVPYGQVLSTFVQDPDNSVDQLSFAKVPNSGADWANVDAKGRVFGLPLKEHQGANSFQVEVRDPAGLSAITTVNITVIRRTFAPKWTQNPIILPEAPIDIAYDQSLRNYVTDADHNVSELVFTKVAGSSSGQWATVEAEGKVSGTPVKSDEGPHEFEVTVTDPDGLSATASIQILVTDPNRPPTIDPNILITLLENEEKSVDLNDPSMIWDPDGDTISCQNLDTLDFVTLDPDCKVTLKPLTKDIGFHTYRIQVTDQKATTEGFIAIQVNEDLSPPFWLQDPINRVAKAGNPFEFCVGDLAKDPKDRPLTFACSGEPTFVTCRDNGCIVGNATNSDIGLHTFGIGASNGNQVATATFNLTIQQGNVTKKIRIGDPVAGAKAENIWLVDSSFQSCSLIRALEKHIDVYYDALNKAQIHHNAVFLSSDAYAFKGKPIVPRNADTLLKWQDPNIVSDFKKRVQIAFSLNRYNSPAWALKLFYDLLPSLNIYKNNFYEQYVPVDALTVTCQCDHYKCVAKEYTPERFAKEYLAFNAANDKAFRFNVMAPWEHDLVSSAPPAFMGAGDTYSRIAAATGGTYYQDIIKNMRANLQNYANQVIQSAYIQAKRVILLDPPPSNPSTITVTLANRPLKGNTGASDDQWSYQASPSAVVLHWDQIDQTNLDPNDLLVIEYVSGRRLALN